MPPVRYATYVNDRYGFAVDRPTFLAPQRPPDNDDGREFRAGRIVMRAYAGWNMDRDVDRTALARAMRDLRGAKPTLAVAKSGGYALSWTAAGTVHYIKSFVDKECETTVEFEYPAAERRRMGPVVTRVVRSLRP